MILATLLTAALTVVTDPLATPSPSASEVLASDLTVASYDLSNLMPDPNKQQARMPLLPLIGPSDDDSGYDEGGFEDDFRDRVVNLVVDVIGRELFESSSDAFAYMIDDDVLLMRATDEVHDALERYLDSVRASTGRSATIELETYRSLGGVTTDVESLVDAVRTGKAALVGSLRREIHVGNTHDFGTRYMVDFVRGYSSEIAHSAAIGDPDMELLTLGSRWLVRLESPVGQDLRLRYAHRQAAVTDWETRDAGLAAVVALNERMAHVSTVGHIDMPNVGVASVWGEVTFGASGGTTWIASQVDTPAGVISYVTRLAVADVAPAPPPVEVRNSTYAWMLDASHLIWRGHRSHHPRPEFLAPTSVRYDGDDWLDATALAFPSGQEESCDNLMSAIYDLEIAEDEEDMDLGAVGSWLFLTGSQAVLAEAAGLSKVFGRATASSSVDVVVTRRQRGSPVGAGTALGQARFDVDTRGRAGTFVGHQQPVVSDFDVEVAQGASLSEPRVDTIFDGMTVEATAVGADVLLDLLLHLRRDVGQVPLHGETFGSLDRVAVLAASVSVRVPRDGERHTWREIATEDGTVFDVHVTVSGN